MSSSFLCAPLEKSEHLLLCALVGLVSGWLAGGTPFGVLRAGAAVAVRPAHQARLQGLGRANYAALRVPKHRETI